MSDPYGHTQATPDWDPSEGLLTAHEVADLCGVSVYVVWSWARNRAIPSLRLPGGDWRFSARWARERRAGRGK